MNFIKLRSHAKINLSLGVIKKLHSKLHKIESIVSFIDLYDEIHLKEIKEQNHKILFYGKFSKRIGKENTVSNLLQILDQRKLLKNKKYLIKIKKNIPHKSGLGGGSMNAANILKYFIKQKFFRLNELELYKIASKIGFDTIIGIHKNSYFLAGNSKIRFAGFNASKYLVLMMPNFGCSSKDIYSKVKNYSKTKLVFLKNRHLSNEDLTKLTNDLEKPAFKKYPKLKKIKLFMENLDKVLFARMSGSGSSIVAYFNIKKDAKKAQKILKKKYKNYWCILSKTI